MAHGRMDSLGMLFLIIASASTTPTPQLPLSSRYGPPPAAADVPSGLYQAPPQNTPPQGPPSTPSVGSHPARPPPANQIPPSHAFPVKPPANPIPPSHAFPVKPPANPIPPSHAFPVKPPANPIPPSHTISANPPSNISPFNPSTPSHTIPVNPPSNTNPFITSPPSNTIPVNPPFNGNPFNPSTPPHTISANPPSNTNPFEPSLPGDASAQGPSHLQPNFPTPPQTPTTIPSRPLPGPASPPSGLYRPPPPPLEKPTHTSPHFPDIVPGGSGGLGAFAKPPIDEPINPSCQPQGNDQGLNLEGSEATTDAVLMLPMPFSFQYQITNNEDGGVYISREEEQKEQGPLTGSYSYQRPDGIYMTVLYEADEDGYRAMILETTTPYDPSESRMDNIHKDNNHNAAVHELKMTRIKSPVNSQKHNNEHQQQKPKLPDTLPMLQKNAHQKPTLTDLPVFGTHHTSQKLIPNNPFSSTLPPSRIHSSTSRPFLSSVSPAIKHKGQSHLQPIETTGAENVSQHSTDPLQKESQDSTSHVQGSETSPTLQPNTVPQSDFSQSSFPENDRLTNPFVQTHKTGGSFSNSNIGSPSPHNFQSHQESQNTNLQFVGLIDIQKLTQPQTNSQFHQSTRFNNFSQIKPILGQSSDPSLNLNKNTQSESTLRDTIQQFNTQHPTSTPPSSQFHSIPQHPTSTPSPSSQFHSTPQHPTSIPSLSQFHSFQQHPTSTPSPSSQFHSTPQHPTTTPSSLSQFHSFQQHPTATPSLSSQFHSTPQHPTSTPSSLSQFHSFQQHPTTTPSPSSQFHSFPQPPTSTPSPLSQFQSFQHHPTSTPTPSSQFHSITDFQLTPSQESQPLGQENTLFINIPHSESHQTQSVQPQSSLQQSNIPNIQVFDKQSQFPEEQPIQSAFASSQFQEFQSVPESRPQANLPNIQFLDNIKQTNSIPQTHTDSSSITQQTPQRQHQNETPFILPVNINDLPIVTIRPHVQTFGDQTGFPSHQTNEQFLVKAPPHSLESQDSRLQSIDNEKPLSSAQFQSTSEGSKPSSAHLQSQNHLSTFTQNTPQTESQSTSGELPQFHVTFSQGQPQTEFTLIENSQPQLQPQLSDTQTDTQIQHVNEQYVNGTPQSQINNQLDSLYTQTNDILTTQVHNNQAPSIIQSFQNSIPSPVTPSPQRHETTFPPSTPQFIASGRPQSQFTFSQNPFQTEFQQTQNVQAQFNPQLVNTNTDNQFKTIPFESKRIIPIRGHVITQSNIPPTSGATKTTRRDKPFINNPFKGESSQQVKRPVNVHLPHQHTQASSLSQIPVSNSFVRIFNGPSTSNTNTHTHLPSINHGAQPFSIRFSTQEPSPLKAFNLREQDTHAFPSSSNQLPTTLRHQVQEFNKHTTPQIPNFTQQSTTQGNPQRTESNQQIIGQQNQLFIGKPPTTDTQLHDKSFSGADQTFSDTQSDQNKNINQEVAFQGSTEQFETQTSGPGQDQIKVTTENKGYYVRVPTTPFPFGLRLKN